MTDKHAPAVVVVAGPTASGKSRLALDLAMRFGGTVVNADAMQVYRGLSILSAAPDAAAMARAPHRLYGVIDPAESCSAGRWRILALAAIEEALAGGRLPIVTGGTGMYLRTLMSGLARIPPVDPAVRAAVRRRLADGGPEALHAELLRRDPDSAARLKSGDRQRIARALEVLESSGRPLSAWLRESGSDGPPPWRFFTILLLPPRAALYAAINARFRDIAASGGLEEVRALASHGLDPAQPAMKALGMPELRRALEGVLPLADAVAAAQQATRRYAKRQVTWFRHQLHPDLCVDAQYSERVKEEIFSQISSFLLTQPT